MTAISADRSRPRETNDLDPTRPDARTTPAASSSTRTALHADADLQRAYAGLGDAPEYAAFLRNVGQEALRPELDRSERIEQKAVARADVEIRARLDAFRSTFAGPYVVDGKTVQARPMFRMNGGFNDKQMASRYGELQAICARAHLPPAAAFNCSMGRPTPEQLVKVTQALIDAGKLPPGTDDSLELRIRQMQWSWGIGVDCAGYTEQAARAARGAQAAPPSHGDAFSGMKNDPRMQKVDVADIRPGDVIHLDPPRGESVGHNVVVYDHEVAGYDDRVAIASRGPDAADFVKGPGPFHILQVDSSWGADDGRDYGGMRRDTWIYDEGTKRWGTFAHGSGAFRASERGPHGEPYTGAFRPKAAR